VSRVFTVIAWAYLLAAAGAVVLGFAATWGWFGVKPDALGMVFALMAALPWSFAIGLIPHGNLGLGLMLVFIGIGLNAALLFWLAHVMRR
jgi:hypothetical protein